MSDSAVQLSLRWGDVVLCSTSAPASRAFVLGRGGDWPLPPEVLGVERFELVHPRSARGGREPVLAVPPGATAWVSRGNASPFRPPPLHPLVEGTRGRVDMGPVSVEIDVGPRQAAGRERLAFGARRLAHHALSAALHAGLFAGLVLLVPRLRDNPPDAEEYADRVAFLLHALDGTAAIERPGVHVVADDDDEPPPGQGGDARRSGGTGTRARGAEGTLGSSVASTREGRVALRGSRDEPDPHLARETTLRDASTFGLVGLLGVASPADPDAPVATWGRDSTRGQDAASTRAPLWGQDLADSSGLGGLGLSGTGEGGGGRSDAIGLGSFGAQGRGAGTGTSDAFGFGDGRGGIGDGGSGHGEGIDLGAIGSLGHGGLGMTGGPGHGVGMQGGGRFRASHHATVRCAGCGYDLTAVNGRLPPEVIQRIVRQSFGRFRGCYEKELDRNPTLEARVTTKFVIARDGSVAMAVSDGPEPLASCVRAGFAALSFPEPAGGTVMVEYPLMLTPTE